MNYQLIKPATAEDWRNYHTIRKAELFQGREYNENHEDEFKPENNPLLFKVDGKLIGTVRMDMIDEISAVIRLVAITRLEQGKGYGCELHNNISELAREKGVAKLFVNAAPEALGYYEKLGFDREIWDESELYGVAEGCVQMSLKL